MDVAPITSLGITKTYDELCDVMYCAFCETSLPALAQQHEGAIIYFVKRSERNVDIEDNNTDRVISLSII